MKAVALWTKGILYPHDPHSGAPPPFHNVTQLIHFVGDGVNGLLGYCRRLHMLYLQELAKGNEVQNPLNQLQALSMEETKQLTQKKI